MTRAAAIRCRFCNSSHCEHGDHCADCGCPQCGFPGARFVEPSGLARGFCPDCSWEAVPGAYKAWQSLQPKPPADGIRELLHSMTGKVPLDVVGKPMLEQHVVRTDSMLYSAEWGEFAVVKVETCNGKRWEFDCWECGSTVLTDQRPSRPLCGSKQCAEGYEC